MTGLKALLYLDALTLPGWDGQSAPTPRHQQGNPVPQAVVGKVTLDLLTRSCCLVGKVTLDLLTGITCSLDLLTGIICSQLVS